MRVIREMLRAMATQYGEWWILIRPLEEQILKDKEDFNWRRACQAEGRGDLRLGA